ncbi:MAG: hypothetical protein COT18_11720 [Elusimicrobia bacterium CG08_land_8_20_14_0_20_59_10]|nr:MAG: hypothetical protein COT18_11720 [Elusimicrobia bacterium CG08_land_8_20_14_0_20_59_10]
MRLIMYAFVFSGFCPGLFLYAGDGRAAEVLNSTGTPPARQAAISTYPATTANAGLYEDMVLIPEGAFLMGSDEPGFTNEHPNHKVFLDAYYIDKFEVTIARYKLFVKAAGRKLPRQSSPENDDRPVIRMTWHDALAYCEYYGKRLPTEAQWEKAAGGGRAGKFSFGNDAALLGEYAWFWGNSGTQIHPVGLKKPNGYGLYDMHGNVLEWTADWYDAGYYKKSPARNPQGPAKSKKKVIKGGSAFVTAELCRTSVRIRSSPDTPYSGKGFRCVAAIPVKRENQLGDAER